MIGLGVALAERGLIPDALLRIAIRRLLRVRLAEIRDGDCEAASAATEAFAAAIAKGPVALVPAKANEQHYEVPPEFFAEVLGRHRKYSCCYYPTGAEDLDAAEAAALVETCRRAELADGMEILELGCGWGSLSLWMAEHYPRARIRAVSNSAPQRAYIEATAAARGLANLTVVTSDMNDFEAGARFDRIVSVEMFEHMHNLPLLLGRVASWLKPGGRLFLHVFCHRLVAYPFEDRGEEDWMTRFFFAGGMMPSDDFLLRFQDDLRLLRRWRWNGRHYQRTAEAWLARMDGKRATIWPILEARYGKQQAAVWWMRWRMFFLAVAECFGYANGQQWWVSHYLFEPRQT